MKDLVVTRLSTTPIKGLRIQHPDAVVLDASGAVGDRDFMLVDDDDKLKSVTTLGQLVRLSSTWDPDSGSLSVRSDDGEVCEGVIEIGEPVDVDCFGFEERPGHVVSGPWDALFERVAGMRLRLIKMAKAGAGSDVKPVTVLGEASVRALERESKRHPIDPRRFRMLIQLATTEEHIEDTWEGAEVSIGTARLRMGGAVPRCAATTRDPDGGARDMPIVKDIIAYRGLQDTGFGRGVPFGVYADVIVNGVVRVGDQLHVDTATGSRPTS